tara:strand:+ start:1237 stop:2157 length:921 start_codon:yes stop_codon:yes gene_type:complete
MKNSTLFTLVCICLISSSWAQNIFDNFDEYKAGEYLGTESGGLWTTWSSLPGGTEDVLVSENNSFSPENSINLTSEGTVMDIVLPLGNLTSGQWTLSYMMKIESGHGAYFNLLHDFAAAASNWAVQVYFNASGSGSLTVGAGLNDPGTVFTHAVESWFEVKINIDIEQDVAEIYFDDVPVYNWMWSEGSVINSSTISALNLYPNGLDGEPDSYFVDDVSFTGYDMRVVDLNTMPSCYPSPASLSFTVDHPQNTLVEVFNLQGKSVFSDYSENLKTIIDCSKWSNSMYVVQLTSSGGLVRKENIVIR